jgi:hypothetical protein
MRKQKSEAEKMRKDGSKIVKQKLTKYKRRNKNRRLE